MTIQTRDFGEMEIDEREVIAFASPIYGFEELKKFVLLYDDELEDAFTWLQSIEQKEICFILTDPQLVMPGYCPELPEKERTALQLGAQEQPVFRVMVGIQENAREATVNLKSPIVINPAKKCAAQVILDEDYPVRTRLMADEEAGTC